MRRAIELLLVAAMSCLHAPAANEQDQASGAELSAAVSARARGDYRVAFDHAERAVSLAPKMIEAHLVLASLADDLCLPSAQPGPDHRICDLAIRDYKRVLDLDASHGDALKSLGFLSYQLNRLDESETYYRQGLLLNRDDPELLCSVAAIDFGRSWRDVAAARAESKLPRDQPLSDAPVCASVRDRNLARIEEGIALLTAALRSSGKNTDLMRYLSALYQTRAEVQCANRVAHRADQDAARKWHRMSEDAVPFEAKREVFRRCPAAPPPEPRAR